MGDNNTIPPPFKSLTGGNGGYTMSQKIMKHDYSSFDHPDVLRFLFHPRKEAPSSGESGSLRHHSIPVDEAVSIGAVMHVADRGAPVILFFHGNGEIASDYDDLGRYYIGENINFLVADYRGYGLSQGSPTVSAMMNDAHAIFTYVTALLKTENFTGALFVMGRSLGSASALEIASSYPDQTAGLIIESGFAHAVPLLNRLGVNTSRLNLREEEGFRHIDKIRAFRRPTLIIHAEFDQIIPIKEGQALFDASPSTQKRFLEIPDADHNTIYAYGLNTCMKAIREMVMAPME